MGNISPPPRSNIPERLFEELAQRNGWRPSKRGWPDFLCFGPNGEIIAVEVKPRLSTNSSYMKILKQDQAAAMDELTKHGIRCYVSDGETLEPYKREKHAPDSRRRKSLK